MLLTMGPFTLIRFSMSVRSARLRWILNPFLEKDNQLMVNEDGEKNIFPFLTGRERRLLAGSSHLSV